LSEVQKHPATKNANGAAYRHRRRTWILALSAIYLLFAAIFATIPLDIDEFTFLREPYELLGGDYTLGYLKQHDDSDALRTIAKSYYFFWKYRPLNAPVIAPDDRSMFSREEQRFGYVRPDAVRLDDPGAIQKYRARQVVPEPDRFYSHGAGKPLLPAILSIPQLALAKCLGITADRILSAQYGGQPDWIFVVFRLAQMIGGLASVLLVFRLLENTLDLQKACLGTLIYVTFPVTTKYFPNLHHDSTLVPFFLLAVYYYLGGRFVAGGVAYGLALASKNLAILLVPVLLLDAAIQGLGLLRQEGSAAALAFVRPRIASLLIMGTVAFAVFVPFANPVSYVEEILTPVISRPIDPRGENVSQWTVKGMVGNESALSPQVTFAQKFLYFSDIGFMYLVLSVFLVAQRKLSGLGRASILVLVLYLPLGSVFGLQLTYRTLLLVPFFCMVAAEVLPPRQLRFLVAGSVFLALIYISDPGRTDLIHNRPRVAGSAG
jgi:hypothetical protein